MWYESYEYVLREVKKENLKCTDLNVTITGKICQSM